MSVPVTLKDTAKQLLANSGSENKHGHIDKQTHIHEHIYTQAYTLQDTLVSPLP